MVVRTLITTADERTWPSDKKEPVLFLGEWCKRYSRKHIWENMNYEVATYHWDDREKLFSDYQSLEVFYEKVLIELSEKLNQTHGVSYSIHYWRILIGPWLKCFIQIIFDRWFMLQFVIKEYKLSNCYFINRDLKSVIPNDMKNFLELLVQDDWNEAIYTELLRKNFSKNFNLIAANSRKKRELSQDVLTAKTPKKGEQKKKIIQSLLEIYNKILPKKNGYFFISSYLPLLAELKLQILLGQFPKIWRSYPTPIIGPEDVIREKWKVDVDIKELFDSIIFAFIPKQIPTVYLEGYQALIESTKKTAWPERLKLIFTSNAYSTDDVFKCWTAGKVELGTPLIIGQHGGHFNMSTFSSDEHHQIKISDKWLSWGWEDTAQPKIIPFGNIKEVGKRMVRSNYNGGAMLVELNLPRYSYNLYSAPIAGQWQDYYKDQVLFVQSLPKEIRQKLTIRLDSTNYGWDQKKRWDDDFPDVKIDEGLKNIELLIKNSRLYIATYNATTCLEPLYLNIPTIIFWNCNHWELRDGAKSYFDLLESVGIFHKTPESAAQQMVKVWDDLEYWWQSNLVQEARIKFCEEYAKKPEDPLNRIKAILNV